VIQKQSLASTFLSTPQQLKLHIIIMHSKSRNVLGRVHLHAQIVVYTMDMIVNIPKVNNIMSLYEVQTSVGSVSTFDYTYQSSLEYNLLCKIFIPAPDSHTGMEPVQGTGVTTSCLYTKPGKDPDYQC
jgi:hypothetical protein